jgi:hypothetical protein
MMKFFKNNSILILSSINLLLLFYLVFFKFVPGGINFQTPSQIGDFVGGVIGTILTAIAAIFVYRTYKNQEEQLGQQKKEANQHLIDNLYNRIAKDVEDLEITFEKQGPLVKGSELVTYKGIYVLYNFKELYKNDNTVLNQLNLILISFEHLFVLTRSATYKWNLQLRINQDRNYLFIYTNIIWPLHKFYGDEWNKLIQELKPPHPDSKGTKDRFEKLVKEAYEYLLKRQLVGMPADNTYKKLLTESS